MSFSHQYALKSSWMVWLGIALTLLLRLWKLDATDLWYDEAHSLNFANHMAEFYRRNLTYSDFPLFHMVLWAWNSLVGKGVFALRLLPVLLSFLGLFYSYRLAKVLYGKGAASWVVVLGAFSPFLVFYAQELRNYSLLYGLLVAALYYAHRLEQSSTAWRKLAIVWGAMMLTHPLGFFHVGGQLGVMVGLAKFRGNPLPKLPILAFLLSIALPLPVYFFALKGLLTMNAGSSQWYPFPSLLELFYSVLHWTFGNGFSYSYSLMFLPLWAVLIYGGWRQLPEQSRLSLPVQATGGLILVIIYSLIAKNSVYISRGFGHFPYLLCLFAAAQLGAPQAKAIGYSWMRNSLLLLIIVLSWVPGLWNHYENRLPDRYGRNPGVNPKPEYRQLKDYLRKHLQPGDSLLHSCRCTVSTFWFEKDILPNQFFVFASQYALDAERDRNPITLDQVQGFMEAMVPQLVSQELLKPGRYWVVMDSWVQDLSHPHAMDSQEVLAWLQQHTTVLESRDFGATRLLLVKME